MVNFADSEAKEPLKEINRSIKDEVEESGKGLEKSLSLFNGVSMVCLKN